jgi:hypothetical protein
VAAGIALAAATVGAQAPTGQAEAQDSSTAPEQQQQSPAQTPPSSAESARRDPFRPIVVKGTGDELPSCSRAGKGGLIIGQLMVEGIVRGRNREMIAVVDTRTNRAYFLYDRDELCNGIVARIAEENVVFEERFRDSSGQIRSREIIKRLSAE